MSALYVKPDTRKRITIPDNYGGNAFSPIDHTEAEEVSSEVTPAEESTAQVISEHKEDKSTSLPLGIGSEELLLLGILLILTQSDEGGDILPFLLILLFIKSGR